MRIDLHSHSTASDGTDPPADVVRRARAAGLDVLALTDHDTVDGIGSARDALPDGLTLVLGCEVSCATERDGRRVSIHLLAYLFDPDEPTFAAERAALRRDRERRAREIVDRLGELGTSVAYDDVAAIAGDAPIGRPHIARALVDAGAVDEFEDAFSQDWIGYGGRAYVAKRALEPGAAARLVRAAGGVSVLAHPGSGRRGVLLDDEQIAALRDEGLGGLEVDHPDHDASTREHLRGLADDLNLLVTGSSDDHGELTGYRLGCETTDPSVYDELVSRATGATPTSRWNH